MSKNPEVGKTVVAQEALPTALPEALMADTVVEEAPVAAQDGLVESVHWEKPKEFIKYIEVALKRIPPYKRTNAASIERALAYYDHLLSEIRKVLHADLEGELTVEELDKLEDVRAQIISQQTALEAILKPLEKAWKKQRGSSDATMQREAVADANKCQQCGATVAEDKSVCSECNAPITAEQKGLVKTATTPSMVYVRDPFIDNLARDIINAKVSSGKNIEASFDYCVKEMSLDKREQYQLIQHMKDIGYPIHRNILNAFGPETYYA